MGVLTNLLKLLKPGENDYYNQQTEQADNWDKVDNYAVLTNTDKNGIWGGEYGGGKIEDPTVVKEVGKRYIGADGKAYICLKPSNINNSTNYAPCNVVDNLDKLQNLIIKNRVSDLFSNVTGWINIPFPTGYNSSNCDIFTECVGSNRDNFWIVKLNFENTGYTVKNIIGTSPDFVIDFFFIKKQTIL